MLTGKLRLFGAALAAAMVSLAGAADVEQTVAGAPWFQRQVGQGVVWKFYQFDNLYGSKQSVSVLEADLTNPEVRIAFPYLENGRGKTSAIVPQQYPEAVAAVNGSFFELAPDPGGSATDLKVNGTVITPERQAGMSVEGALCRTTSEVISILKRPPGGWESTQTLTDVMANGPILVYDEEVPPLSPYGAICTTRHPRTAVGVTTTSRLLLVTVDGRTDGAIGMTCEEMAWLMRDLGCDDAVNMDGGGSTTMWIRGEENNGVVNYPSDNGAYDHLGERSCSNAIAVIAPPAPRTAWDARVLEVKYSKIMFPGTTQTVTVSYRNIGTQPWARDEVSLRTTRPDGRISPLATTAGWPAPDTAAVLADATVAPDEVTTFSFLIAAPDIPTTNTTYYEHFGLTHKTVGRFGPPDNEPRLKIIVQQRSAPTTGTIIIESRPGGKNYAWYSEEGGWADVRTDCTAPGLTPGIGMRTGSTFLSAAESKSATFTPDFAQPTTCDVYVTWGAAPRRRSPITYKVTDTSGTATYLIDQSATADEWVLLGRHSFDAGAGGSVTMSNENVDVSGSMYSAAVKFEPVTAGAGAAKSNAAQGR